MVLFWIIVLVLAVVLEAATTALVSIWFGLGAVAALVVASMTDNVFIQLLVFTVTTTVCIAFTRPFIANLLPKKHTPTNAELNVGKSAVSIEIIDNARGTGRVKLDGVDWSAVSEDGSVIPGDTVVTVTEVRSAKLVVKINH